MSEDVRETTRFTLGRIYNAVVYQARSTNPVELMYSANLGRPKACPFCGGLKVLIGRIEPTYRVSCMECGGQILGKDIPPTNWKEGHAAEMSSAIEAWNRRSHEDAALSNQEIPIVNENAN